MSARDTIVRSFDPKRVRPFAGQPRKRFTDLDELARSIKAVGQLIPGKVILVQDDPKFDAQLIDGERRLRACIVAGRDFRAEVEAKACTEDELFERSLAANFGKQDHDCIEIAQALGRLRAAGRSTAQMADLCGGKSGAWVLQHLSLLELHPDVQELLIAAGDGKATLAFTTATMLAHHPKPFQLEMARKIKGLSMVEARRVILKAANKAGVRATKESVSRRDLFSSLQSVIHHLTHRLGVFSDMKPADLRACFFKSGNIEKRELVNAINALNDELSGIADELEKTL